VPKAVDTIDPGLLQFATPRQLEIAEAVEREGSMRKACKALGMEPTAARHSIARLKARAALAGYSPGHDWTKPVPPTHIAKGVSTYYDADGKVRGQWVKADVRRGEVERIVRAIAEDLASGVPREAPAPAPVEPRREELLTLYTLTDSHVGMLAWGKETGHDWDLDIAERVLTGCFEHMVAGSPASGVAIVNQLGDLLHQDGMQPITPTSGHILDADSRFEKVVKVAVRILRRVIAVALAKHDRVIVLMAEGNHDIASSVWLRTLFAALYENEPRVTVIDSPLPYYAVQHGETMLAFHHGHLKKNDQLPLLFASQFSQMWGLTAKRYCHTGHRHHVEEKEHSGMTVIQHPTLAARDAYAARGGWIAERQVSSLTYHKQWGQVSKITVVPEMLQA
jgi:hypothetical protein